MDGSSGVVEIVRAMRRLEQGAYRCSVPSSSEEVATRTAIMQWTFQILQFLELDAIHIAPIALNYVDRYVSVHTDVLQDRSKYLRVSMTALYTALKIHGTGALLDPSTISTLSRDRYTVGEIEAQERHLLETLMWRLSPPTAVQYVLQFAQLLPCLEQERERVERTALQQLESSYGSGSCNLPASQAAIEVFLKVLRICFNGTDLMVTDLECFLAEFLDCEENNDDAEEAEDIQMDEDEDTEIHSREEVENAIQDLPSGEKRDLGECTSPQISAQRKRAERRFSPRAVDGMVHGLSSSNTMPH